MPPAVRRPLVLIALCALALAVAGAALADNAGFTPAEPRSPNAEAINASYNWVVLFTGAIFLIVQGALILFVVRYRRGRRRRTDEGAQVHGNTNLELAWTVAPVLILVAIGAFIFYKLPQIRDIPEASAAGEEPLEVTVKGYRFYWQYEYPNGTIALDRLRAPVDGNVRLLITAPDFDVIHSWWIPSLGGKFDAIPGRTNESWFRASQEGVYRGQCGEFCGVQHAAMTATVEVVPREEFDRWLEEEGRAQEAGRSETFGREIYDAACAKCHALGGEGDLGPPLKGNALVNDAEAIASVVRNGRGAMPPVGKDWEERQMDALTSFLEEEFGSGG
jgi:cytochrome c oxidase subunit II